jgi:1-acyl-sn-glycerol-3-phosphate acyltransferase
MSSNPPAASFSGFERMALALARFTNENPRAKAVCHNYLVNSIAWMRHFAIRRLYSPKMDQVHRMNPDRGIMFVANHRSFFDMYAVMIAMYWRGPGWTKQLFFPVRSNFFYEKPVGVILNYALGGGSMYPPIFRDPAKSSLNQLAVDKIVDVLREPGTLVGMHPEGKRGTGRDPYEILPAQPGVGQMIMAARPIVIPLFINGLTNDIVKTVKSNFSETAHQDPLTLIFGDPMDFSEFDGQKLRAALYKKVADKTRDAIVALGEEDRRIRARIASGEIGDDDLGWLTNQPRG